MFGLLDINNFFSRKVQNDKQRTQQNFCNIYYLSSDLVFIYPWLILF